MKAGKLIAFSLLASAIFSNAALAASPADFLKHVPISLSASAQAALGEETLSGFPVLVRLSTAISGFSYDDIATNHSDIAFGTDDGSVITLYPFEVDTWNTNGTSLVWVRVPSLAAASSFNFYYGNGGSVANTPSDVWTGYAGVWHLNEDSNTAVDSTANGLDATASGANSSECVAVSTAPTGTGRQLASVKGHKSYLSVPNYDSLGLGGTFTISAWVKADLCDIKYSARYFSRKGAYTDKNGWEAEQRYDASSATIPATTISARGANSGDYTATLPDITANWAYVVLSYNGTTLQYYVNGAKAETCALNSGATDNGKTLSFGNNPSGSESNWVGAMDEIRLRGFVPTEAWEAAEYATVANSSFLVYGMAMEYDRDAPKFGTSSASVSGNNVAFSVALDSVSGPTAVSVFYSADGGTTFAELPLGTANAPGTLTGTASDLDIGGYVWYARAVSSVGGADHASWTSQSEFAVTHAKDPVAACKCFTVTIAYGGTAVADIPVLVRLSQAGIEGFRYEDVTASGFEFLDEAGNLLPYEIDTWNTDGESFVWVLVPSFSDGAELTVRYGTDFANARLPATDVWAKYVAVWHMNEILEDPATGTHYTPDSSASGWHAYKSLEEDAVPEPVTNATGVTAHPAPITGTAMNISYGASKSNTDLGGFIVPATTTASTPLCGPGFTVSAIVNSQQAANDGRCRVIAFGNAYNDIANLAVGSDNIYCMGSSSHNKPNPKGKTGWVCVSDVFGSPSFIYADGTNRSGTGGNPNLASLTPSKGIGLGCFTDGKQCLNGYLDEARIRNAASTAEYIAAEYAAMADESVVSFSCVSVVDEATSVLTAPTVLRNADGSFTVAVEVTENVPASVVCNLGGTDYAMSTLGSALPLLYSVTVSNLSPGTYVAKVQAVSTTGNSVYSVCPTAFHAGALTVTKNSDADEGTLAPGVFRVARADADATGLPAITFDVEFSGAGLAAVNPPGITSATIPEGEEFVDIRVVPVYTTEVTVDTEVAMDVSGAYVGQPSSATMTVFNADFDPSVRYVATDGDDANHGGTTNLPKKTISAAVNSLLNVAQSQPCVVHVAPGLYQSPSPVVVTNAISVLGDDPDPSRTVVSNIGQINYYGSHNQRLFTIDHADALVANLTMQKGIAYYDISGGDFYIGSKGGTVSNCVVEAGDANSNGHAGGGYMDGGRVTHTVFRKNTCYSGSANWARNRPGVLSMNGYSTAENCLFDDNPQPRNVVLIAMNGHSAMRNCSIVNTGLSVTNADCSAWSSLHIATEATVQNVVIAGVTNIVDGAPCPPTWTRTNFLNSAFDGNLTNLPEGTIGGTAEQFFEDYANGDYTPKTGGPLVNVGEEYEGMAAVDLAGNNRKNGKRVDIGCYENQKSVYFFIIVR